jgi:hypothetical protein
MMRVRAICFILMILLFFGCVQYEYDQKIDETGASKVQIIADYKQKILQDSEANGIEYQKALGEFIDDKNKRCEKIRTEKNASCIVDGSKIIISADIFGTNEFYSFEATQEFTQTIYLIEIKKIPFIDYVQDIPVREINLEKNEIEWETAQNIKKESGISAKYSIEVPGKIEKIETNLSGIGYENKLVFDMFDMVKNPSKIKITSKKTSTEYVYGILIIIVIGFILLTYFIIQKQQQKEAEE